MHRCFRQRHPIVFLTLCLLLFPHTRLTWATEVTASNTSLDGGVLTYTLTASSPPQYNVMERFAPFRVVMDVKETTFTAEPTALPQNSFVQMQVEDLQGPNTPGKRFIFTLADSHDYNVKQDGNRITIVFTPAKNIKQPAASAASPSLTLNDLQVISTPNSTSVVIHANKKIEDYSVDKLTDKNPQMIIDIPNANISGLAKEKIIGSKALARVNVVPRGDGGRLIFESAQSHLFAYSVAPSPSGLEVVINENENSQKTPSTSSAAKKKGAQKANTLDELISSSEKLAGKDPETVVAKTPLDKLAALEESFSLSGYKAQRITVDFYKIDIHNVFRLFREITDLNIIVDENVQGSLTLALNDVPWDFALDIILNLMNLKKEERFNTIVIYPADKEFIWPTRAEENLSFQPDMQIIEEQDALLVEKTQHQPAEVLKAKELLDQARYLEGQNNLEDAILLYDKALSLWPTNGNLSNRLARIHLVELGMNAKALHYANQTLKNHPESRTAALYAAIASANMERLPQANEFFIQSISDTPPMREALLSYASFCENNAMNEAALKLLEKHERYYGENANTMVSTARILDKIGKKEQAKKLYQAVLASGYQITPDLRQYILQRISEKTDNPR